MQTYKTNVDYLVTKVRTPKNNLNGVDTGDE